MKNRKRGVLLITIALFGNSTACEREQKENEDYTVYALQETDNIDGGIPPSCDLDKKTRKKYLKGVGKGFSIAEKAWRKRAGCHEFEIFETELYAEIQNIQVKKMDEEERLFKQCRFAGMLDGIYNMVEEIDAECFEICANNGVLVGTLAAKTFCELMIYNQGAITVDGWVRGPLGICGANFEIMCDITYYTKAIEFENEDGICFDYTIGQYEHSFEAYGEEKCAFDNNEPKL